MSAKTLLGCEVPRIFTPAARELSQATSDGPAVIAFAEELLGLKLFPWQKWLLMHGLELDESGLYRFRTVCVTVARQSGKTMLMIVLALWHVYCRGSRSVIGTAQDLANAERAWGEAVELAQSDDELAELIDRITLAHPKVLRLVTGCEYRVASASRRGARGFSGDLILMDELREHQSWDSWASISNTMNARPKAQAWCFSNAGDALSIVLRYLRTSAHQSLGWPDGDADRDVLGEVDADAEGIVDLGDDVLGWFEWSVPPAAKRTDRSGWAQANPSLNHVEVIEDCVTERALAAQLRTSPPHVFETEVLCRWVSMCDGGPFPEGSWAATLDAAARPAAGARSVVCLDLSWNRSVWSIARAALDDQGDPVVGIAAARAGSEWVVPWLLEQRDTFDSIVLPTSAGSPALSLLDELEQESLPVTKWAGPDVGAGTGQMFDRLRDGKIRHLPHPGLDSAATSAAIKTLAGGAWVIDRIKSPTDAAPLQAAIGAVWGLVTADAPFRSAYEDADLVIL